MSSDISKSPKGQKKERCINCKQDIIRYMEEHLSGFEYSKPDTTLFNHLYGFVRINDDGIYDYLILRRNFADDTIDMQVHQVISCYQKRWWDMRFGTNNIVCGYASGLVEKWYSGANTIEGVISILTNIKKDYVKTKKLEHFYQNTHEAIAKNKDLVACSHYIQNKIFSTDRQKINAISEWIDEMLSQYGKLSIKERPTLPDYCIQHFHPVFQGWVEEIISTQESKVPIPERVHSVTCYGLAIFRDCVRR